MGIGPRIRIFAVSLIAISSIVMALVTYWGTDTSLDRLQAELLRRCSESEAKRLQLSFAEIEHDVLLIAGLPSVAFIANNSADEDAGDDDDDDDALRSAKDDLATVFDEILSVKPHYSQVRLIGDGGREIVRLDRVGDRVVQVPAPELQWKGEREYVVDATRGPAGVPYFAPMSLNREHGEVEVPHRPMLRVAVPIHRDQGGVFGIVVINLEVRPFLDDLFSDESGRYRYYLTNADGYYLYHPDPSMTYGFDLGREDRAQREFPELDGLYGDEGASAGAPPWRTFKTSHQRLAHFRKFHPYESERWVTKVLGVEADLSDVRAASTTIGATALGFVLVFLLIGVVAAFFFATKLTRPIEQVAQAAKDLSVGRRDAALPINRRDEIGDLARSFESMRSAIVRHEARLMDANERLTQANRDLEHFAHLSSHELREPINRVASLASLLKLDEPKFANADAPAILDHLKEESVRMLDQITDFRTFARISEGTMLRESVRIREVVEAVLEPFRQRIHDLNVEVRFGDLPELDVYRNLVAVIYRNLIQNALDYARRDSIVLEFTAEVVDGCPVLGVYNNGSSIAEEKRDAVFDLYTRLADDGRGTGVGLSICKRIVMRHSGKIWVESNRDDVHFKFTLGSVDV